MNLKKKLLTGLASGLFLCLQVVCGLDYAEAVEPKEPAKDILHILGFYYGNGENIIIREDKGRLELLYRYAEEDKSFSMANRYPMTKVHFDSYTINEAGPMGGSETTVRFDRDPDGFGITCRVGGHMYTRSFFGYTSGERNKAYTIPTHEEEGWKQMRAEAAAAVEPGKLKQGKTVELINAKRVAGLKVKSIYGAVSNFFSHPLYDNDNLYLAKEAVEALERVQSKLEAYGYGLVLYDAYRPWHISKLANLALPKNQKNMLEDPEKQGSSHNTGLAVDVSLIELASGNELEMPSAFDEPSPRQYSSYAGGTERQRYRREVLRSVMQEEGFKGIEMEWWHFEYGKLGEYAHMNTSYAELPEQ